MIKTLESSVKIKPICSSNFFSFPYFFLCFFSSVTYTLYLAIIVRGMDDTLPEWLISIYYCYTMCKSHTWSISMGFLLSVVSARHMHDASVTQSE